MEVDPGTSASNFASSVLLFYLKKKVWQTQTLRFLESGNNEVETSLSVQISPKHDAWLHARLHLEGF